MSLSVFNLEIKRFLIKLRLTRAAWFHFNHGGALMGLMCRAMRTHELPPGVMPFACESGRVHFDAGDLYHFGLTLVGAARQDFDVDLFGTELKRIGAQTHDSDKLQPTLSSNFEIASIELLPPPDLDHASARLKKNESLTLHFLSPLRLERPPALRVKGAGYLNSDCFPPDHFMGRLLKRLFLLAHDRYPESQENAEMWSSFLPAGETVVDPRHLLWLDIPLEGAPGKHERQPKGYTLGGVIGKVTLSCVTENWLAPLVAGQYVHAGEKTHYGLGRYVIEECNTAGDDPFRPAQTMFDRLPDPPALQEALGHVIKHSTALGADGMTPDDVVGVQDLLAAQVATELRVGTYRPSPLLGFVAPKDHARLRPLAVPTVRDRMVQRASCMLLSPAIETLLEDCSYAYRKGYSRVAAARAIERAYEEGYRYVLDADIDSFFDAVEWERIFAKLDALFPFEPLVTLIKEWVTAPVEFEGAVIRRERGLPQGAPVSPLLANLYLDEFDEELLGRDYRLVRYGDDFVVLCKDLETAQQAREDARHKLAGMGLMLNEEKTAIHSLDEGFTYLGYLFCRSLVIEKKREHVELSTSLTQDVIPKASWLSQVPFKHVQALIQRRISNSAIRPATAVEVVPLSPLAQPSPVTRSLSHRRTLYVTSFETTVRREGETLVVCAPEQAPLNIPIRELSHVVCYGRVRITVPVLLALCEQGILTYFCHRSGELKGVFGATPAGWQLWMAQATLAANEAARVRFAREVVAAKLHNFAALAVRFKLAQSVKVARELRGLEQSCVNKTTLEALNGLEGRGAALYFGAMSETLAGEWNFRGRRTQPPPEPINAMLSYGYTLLYHQLSTALVMTGLNPRIGLFHTEHGAYHALACDLQEEFRHLVDAQVWAMVNRHEVKPVDFYASEDGRYPCLMKPELRKKFIATFEKRLSSEFTNDNVVTTYRAVMESQARQLKDLVTNDIAHYRPLRTRDR